MLDIKKRQIVESALKRFSHYGFHKTSMNEIADDLRMTKANLYYYYQDKSSLVSDCVSCVMNDIINKEKLIIGKEDLSLKETIFELLDFQAQYLRRYYMLDIRLNDNLDWIQGSDFYKVMKMYDEWNVERTQIIFQRAVDHGKLIIHDIDNACDSFTKIIKGLSVLNKLTDIMLGIPDISNVDKILEDQKNAVNFILEGKLI